MVRSPSIERCTRAAFALALLVTLPRTSVAADSTERSLRFARHAETVAVPDLAWLRAEVASRVVRVHEPYEDAVVGFDAFPFDRVLDAIYGPAWRGEEELLFTCRDGYQPALPVRRFVDHRAWLAFGREGREEFELDKLESGSVRRIGLGPFYLVWENLDDPVVRQEADYGWPYQLVGVELIRRLDRFPRMAPAADASATVRDGFEAFRIHCSKCHRINGEGGSIGPELNAGVNPVEYRDDAWLRSWITEPDAIRPGTRMPPLNPLLPDRDRTVDRILAYLGHMASRSRDGR